MDQLIPGILAVTTGLGLSVSSGVNAYIPLLAVGLLARFTDIVPLSDSWDWLSNPWVLGVLGLLLVIEFFADKIPVVDSVNDAIHTVIRPTSGGLVVGAATVGGETTVTDPHSFVTSGAWIPVLSGALVALAVHLGKAALRGLANTVTAGMAAPVLSVGEDVTAVVLSLTALLAPVVAALVVVLLLWIVVRMVMRRRASPAATA
jgi:hypothetical protein